MLILRGASGPIGLGGELHGDSFFIFCLASFHTLRGNHTKTLHDARQHPGNPSSRLIIKPAGQIDLGACAPACCAGLGLWQARSRCGGRGGYPRRQGPPANVASRDVSWHIARRAFDGSLASTSRGERRRAVEGWARWIGAAEGPVRAVENSAKTGKSPMPPNLTPTNQTLPAGRARLQAQDGA